MTQPLQPGYMLPNYVPHGYFQVNHQYFPHWSPAPPPPPPPYTNIPGGGPGARRKRPVILVDDDDEVLVQL